MVLQVCCRCVAGVLQCIRYNVCKRERLRALDYCVAGVLQVCCRCVVSVLQMCCRCVAVYEI